MSDATMTPTQAWAELSAGNQRFAEGRSTNADQDLARSDGPAGYRAMAALLGAPEQAAEFLGQRLVPVPPVEEVQAASSSAAKEMVNERVRGTEPPSHAGRLESDATIRKAPAERRPQWRSEAGSVALSRTCSS